MNSRKLLFIIGVGVLISSCSTQYQRPDYYASQKLSVTNYDVGEVYDVDDLRCSDSGSGCVEDNRNLPEGWVAHRAYKKAYYFE